MMQQPAGGVIVNIASIAGVYGSTMMPHYGAAKSGVIMLTRELGVAWGRKGIRVPRDVSVICMTTGPMFSLLPRCPAHFKWPIDEHVRRVNRWVKCLAKGRTDLAQETYSATFEPGETIAAVKGVGVKERRPAVTDRLPAAGVRRWKD